MCMINSLLFLILFAITSASTGYVINKRSCIPRDFGHGSPVCVCNSTYCDSLELSLSDIPARKFFQLTSSQDGQRFDTFIGHIQPAVNYEGMQVT